MQDLVLGDERKLRRETPEVRFVEDVRDAVSGMGPEARRLLESLPTWGRKEVST